MFYFIPVEGNFTDATFVHSPLRRKQKEEKENGADEKDYEDEDYDFSDIVLVVMAAFGSMMVQVCTLCHDNSTPPPFWRQFD